MSAKIFFTPGPSQLFYTFQDHWKQALLEDVPSISHRSKQFTQIVQHTNEHLRELMDIPEEFDIFFLNAANEAWDRIIQNLVVQHSHHFVNGYFSRKFYDFALMHGMQSTATNVNDGQSFDNFSVPANTELIGITKNETSVGYSFTEEEIALLREENPNALIALDVVSASPSLPVNFKHIDSAYFSVQKAFGIPAGLGVWICNQRCQEKAEEKATSTSLGSYRALPNLKKFADKDQTPETPNMLYIYLLGKIAEDMLRLGKQRVVNDTIYKSAIIYQAIKDHPSLEPFVASQKHRSKTTVVAASDEAPRIIEAFDKRGMVLGSGYGAYKDAHVRIANFPTHSKESVEQLCDLLSATE